MNIKQDDLQQIEMRWFLHPSDAMVYICTFLLYRLSVDAAVFQQRGRFTNPEIGLIFEIFNNCNAYLIIGGSPYTFVINNNLILICYFSSDFTASTNPSKWAFLMEIKEIDMKSLNFSRARSLNHAIFF